MLRQLQRSLLLVGALAFASVSGAEDGKHNYFTTKDGIKIHYVTLGSKGSYVILHHGYTGSAEGNWMRNGVAAALAKNHRVVAIDARNHGRSDKPTPQGQGIPEDVIELMDHLKVQRVHLHGYSMGGGITARILASHPQRLITASFGGSGIRETDPNWVKLVPADREGRDPQEDEASKNLRIRSLMDNGRTREQALADYEQAMKERETQRQATTAARPAAQPLKIDLRSLDIPLLAINGEFDAPYSKTFRLWREAKNFTNVILPGKSHLTAIAAPYMPKEYTESLVAFIDAHDE
jgi:pimeloyl-ACP methyl ester carboxylesterase